jgi:hypothetical protein
MRKKMMSIEQEIRMWLQDRPNWQQEAIERTLEKGKLNDLIQGAAA